MERIRTLLQKINDLSYLNEKTSTIDIDLMMDYTKVLYADLLEMRKRTAFNNNIPVFPGTTNTTKPINTESEQNNDIHSKLHIGINDKYLFISELFGNNKEKYENTLEELNQLNTYQQAIDLLQQKHNWSSENETATTFYELLRTYYNQ